MFTLIVYIFLDFFLHISQKCSTFALELIKMLSATFAIKP
jgi:hypothetical protein